MINQYCTIIESPVGPIRIFADDQFITKITFKESDTTDLTENEHTKLGARQLEDYFSGKLQAFTLPLAQPGTEFQQHVWNNLVKINYASTLSYLQFSKQMNNPLAIRAIAAANGKNNLAIVVPCHRVIGSNGKLVGYAGGLWRKQWLLEHERSASGKGQTTLIF